MPEKLSMQQFAATIKAKYPDYASVPDDELVRRITYKYPDYLSMVQFDDPNAAIKAQQAAKYPTAAETGVTDNRSAAAVARDQALQVVYGIPQLVTGPLSAIYEGAGAVKDMAMGRGSQRMQSLVSDTTAGALTGTAELIGTPVRGAAALVAPESVQAPTQQEWERHAQASGANAAGVGVGGVISKITPEGLMTRAANNRAAVADSRAPSTIPTNARSAAVQAASRMLNPARRLAAAVEERVAKWIAESPKGNTAALAVEQPPVSILPDNPRSPSAIRAAAQDEARRATTWEQSGSAAAESQPLGIQRPGVPQFVDDALEAGRRQADFDNAPQGFIQTQRPTSPSQPLEVPEGFGSSMTERASGPTAAEITATERAIKPLGRKAQQSTIRNIPQLAKVAPELFPVDYQTFPAKAMQSLERMTKTIETAEAAVPRETMVPRQPILDGFAALAEEYKARGIPSAELAIENVAKRWLELPEQIPWEQFVKMKRGFFDNTATAANSTPLMRAYGHLMDASSKVSTALAEANRAYSIVRRAMQDAGVDVRSGRRIREVGK